MSARFSPVLTACPFCQWVGLLALLLAATGAYGQPSHLIVEGDIYTLGVVAVPGENYEWRFYTDHMLLHEADSNHLLFLGGNTGSVIPIQWLKTGLYYFTVAAIDPGGCMNLKVGLILVSPGTGVPALQIVVDRNPVCPGDRVTFRATTRSADNRLVYQWLKNDVSVGENDPFYTDTTLRHNDVIRCFLVSPSVQSKWDTAVSNKITMMVVSPSAAFRIEDNQRGVKGACRMINLSLGADDFFWDFGNGQFSAEESPAVTFTEDGTYPIRLVAVNKLYCRDTFYLSYTILFTGLYIPNAFAPDIKGVPGSLFQPAGINLKEYSIEIYNNWGDLLWESAALDELGQPAEAWDGTYHGAPLPQGTYMWKVHAVFRDNTLWTGSDIGKGRSKTIGTVTLIR